MARKDLAGIAALAGLGMLMANKGKKGSKADRDVSDREDAREPDVAEEDAMEAANKRTERTLTPNQRGAAGTSETMYPSAKPSGGAAPAAAAVKPAVMPVPPMRDSEAGMSRGTRNVSPTVSMAGAGRGGRGGPTAEELASYKPPVSDKYPDIRGSAADSERANMRKNIREGSQAVEGVYPEQAIGGPGLRTAQSIAKGLAGKFGGDSAKAASPFLKELPYGGPKQLPNAPTKQLTGPSKADLMARDRAARATGRNEEMARENARRYGLNPDDMSATTSSLLRKNMGGDDFSLPLKKGGMAKRYAAGGSVSSASRRADGIATKGKTRGKMC